ncbi:MAG: glycosyltransferase family 2 protein [Helicobacter sp.]|uniref:glycosyltransferase family 2 protein n=1 Tax=Helicobacter sp. TaxID=218 RepID=UPI002A774ED1|nr:glycosyltransferase family 2 protein [Helicobacter sp.]
MDIIALELESMQKNPTFSIIIPTYNVERYIARCLESCIHQTFGDIEILVIDDCGNDKSIEIAKTHANRDLRISIIHNPHNLGIFASRLEGIKYAQGHYTLMLDADDYLVPNACEILAPYDIMVTQTTMNYLCNHIHLDIWQGQTLKNYYRFKSTTLISSYDWNVA